MTQYQFPDGFLWGGATADFQYEGGFGEGYTNLDQHTAYMADGSMYAFFIKTDVNNMVRYWQKEGDFK